MILINLILRAALLLLELDQKWNSLFAWLFLLAWAVFEEWSGYIGWWRTFVKQAILSQLIKDENVIAVIVSPTFHFHRHFVCETYGCIISISFRPLPSWWTLAWIFVGRGQTALCSKSDFNPCLMVNAILLLDLSYVILISSYWLVLEFFIELFLRNDSPWWLKNHQHRPKSHIPI